MSLNARDNCVHVLVTFKRPRNVTMPLPHIYDTTSVDNQTTTTIETYASAYAPHVTHSCVRYRFICRWVYVCIRAHHTIMLYRAVCFFCFSLLFDARAIPQWPSTQARKSICWRKVCVYDTKNGVRLIWQCSFHNSTNINSNSIVFVYSARCLTNF